MHPGCAVVELLGLLKPTEYHGVVILRNHFTGAGYLAHWGWTM